jgi:hypothetical protein
LEKLIGKGLIDFPPTKVRSGRPRDPKKGQHYPANGPYVTAEPWTAAPKPVLLPESMLCDPADAAIAKMPTVQSLDWDEVVAGYTAGNVDWYRNRLGPRPGEAGCRALAEVLEENGFPS